MNLIKKNMTKLKEVLSKSENDFDIHIAEDLLYKISDSKDPAIIEFLISLLDDNFPYDEFMFSIIHCIEDFEDEVYLFHLLKTVPEFIYRAPRWAYIVHMRILNSPQTLFVYADLCRQAGMDQKTALRSLLLSINRISSEFVAKTALLLDIL